MKKQPTPPETAHALRRRAEDRLSRRPARKSLTALHADSQRLVQELQIHQIELELQNEELKQAKARVEEGLEKYTDLYEFAPVGYFSLDEKGLILDANLTGSTLLGVERCQLIRRCFQTFVAPRSRPAFDAFFEKIFTGQGRQSCETSLMAADRTVFWADLQATSATPRAGADTWCRVAVTNIEARKQAEEAQRRVELLAASNRKLEEEIVRRQATETALKKSELHTRRLLEQSRQLQEKLRRISHQILTVQEDQRKKISRELHDEISQLLVGIIVHLVNFTKEAELNPDRIRKTITPLRRLVEKSVLTVHRFARELRPAMLDDLGLIPALRAYIDSFHRKKGRCIRFMASTDADVLDNDRRTVLYRVAQESLVNMARHSQARVVTVRLLKIGGRVILEISDDGKAFDVARLTSARWNQRLGLVGMRERVEMVGGRFSVESAPGAGTTVRAEVPVQDIPD
ncbi:PAS domain S-box protein [Opitutaceae bacterium TAV4]|nr:PAS domain S-box protein [Opitutaceae bacterium TAV4]RRK00855.1 PAS domain S-box protein [Opitutaceae bacterium TAV3]